MWVQNDAVAIHISCRASAITASSHRCTLHRQEPHPAVALGTCSVHNMGRKRKHQQTYEYDDPEKAAELEQVLFRGIKAGAVFSAPQQVPDEEDSELDIDDLLDRGGDDALDALIEEDRAGTAAAHQDDSDSAASSSSSEDEDSEGKQTRSNTAARKQRSAAAAVAAADSDEDAGSSSESEGDEEEEEEEEGAGPGPSSQRQQQLEGATKKRKSKKGQRAAAWNDPADEAVQVRVADKARNRALRSHKGQQLLKGEEYAAALRKKHALLNPNTAWARPKGAAAGGGTSDAAVTGDDAAEPSVEAVEKLLRTAGGLLASKGRGGLLGAGAIEVSRLRDANTAAPSDAVVKALQWHPNGQLLMTAGMDKKLRLFQVDGLHNPLVQTLYLGDCPIVNAAFAAGGQMAVAAGRRPFYYLVDLAAAAVERVVAPPMLAGTSSQRLKSLESFAVSPAVDNPLVAFLGDGGNIGLVSLRSRQCVGTLKMSGSARSAVFTPDGQHLITSGGDGVIYTWDLRSRRCLHKQLDEGAVGAATLCLSPDGSYLATGSTSGVVNLYRRPQGGLLEPLLGEPGALRSNGLQPAVVPPVKALMNLVTNVDTLAFNHDSQILLMASRMKKDALRLVHLPSATVFANWPTAATPLHYVHSAGFSPHSGFLAVGNAKGRALLYRLHHYPSI